MTFAVVAIFLILLLAVFLLHRYSYRKLGIEKIKQFLQVKEQSIDKAISNKLLQLGDAEGVLSIELKKFHHLRGTVEKNLYALDEKLNEVTKTSHAFDKTLKHFTAHEAQLSQTLSSSQKHMEAIESHKDLSQKIQHEIQGCMTELSAFQETLKASFAKMESDFQNHQKQTHQTLQDNMSRLENQVTDNKQALENTFLQKIDDMQLLTEQLKSGMEDKQNKIFEDNEAKITAFFQEQIALSKEDIQAIRATFQESETRLYQHLSQTEERQKRLAEKQQTFYEEFDQYKEMILQKMSESSDIILEGFKQKIQDYEDRLVVELDEKYQGFTQKASAIEAELKTKEEQTIQDADEQFQTIQKSILDYKNLLTEQVDDITKQYQHIKEELIKNNQQELKHMSEDMLRLKADFAKVENLNQIKLERLNHLMKYIDDAKKTIQQKIKAFEEHFDDLDKKLRNLSEEDLPLVMERGGKLKKRINEILRKEMAVASQEMKSQQKAIYQEANTYLEDIKTHLMEKGANWQQKYEDKQSKSLMSHFQKVLEDYLAQEKTHVASTMSEIEAELKQTISLSEEEIAALKDKYNEVHVFIESMDEELSNMQAKRADFKDLEEQTKALYIQQTQSASQLEASLKEKAFEHVEGLEKAQVHLLEKLSTKQQTLIRAMDTLHEEALRQQEDRRQATMKMDGELQERIQLIEEGKTYFENILKKTHDQLAQETKAMKTSFKASLKTIETKSKEDVQALLKEAKRLQDKAITHANTTLHDHTLEHLDVLKKSMQTIEANLKYKGDLETNKEIEILKKVIQEKTTSLEEISLQFQTFIEIKQKEHTYYLNENQDHIKTLHVKIQNDLKTLSTQRHSIEELHTHLSQELTVLENDKKAFSKEMEAFLRHLHQEKQGIQHEMERDVSDFKKSLQANINNLIMEGKKSYRDEAMKSIEASLKDVRSHVNAQKQTLLKADQVFDAFIKSQEDIFGKTLETFQEKIERFKSQEDTLKKNIDSYQYSVLQIEKSIQQRTADISQLEATFEKTSRHLKEEIHIHHTTLMDDNQKTMNTLEQNVQKQLSHFTFEEKNKLEADFKHHQTDMHAKTAMFEEALASLENQFETQMKTALKELNQRVEREVLQANEDIKALSYKKDKRFLKFERDLERVIEAYRKKLEVLIKKNRDTEARWNEKNEALLAKQSQTLQGFMSEHMQKAKTDQEQFTHLQRQTEQLMHTGNHIIHSLQEQSSILKQDYQEDIKKLSQSHHKKVAVFIEELRTEAKDKVNEQLQSAADKIKHLSQTLEGTTQKFDSLYKTYKASIAEHDDNIKVQFKQIQSALHNFMKAQKARLQEDFKIIEAHLSSQEKTLSEDVQSKLKQIDEDITRMHREIEHFVSQTELFSRADSFKEKIDQQLSHYRDMLKQIKQDTLAAKSLEGQNQWIKKSYEDIKTLMKTIESEKKNILTVEKSVRQLSHMASEAGRRLESIEKSKHDLHHFMTQIETYREESKAIQTTFETVLASHKEVQTSLETYHALAKKQEAIVKHSQHLESDQNKINIAHKELSQTLKAIQDKALNLESNQKKLLEFNEKYEQLDMTLQDVAERKKLLNKMRQELHQEKQSMLDLKNTLNEHIKTAISLTRSRQHLLPDDDSKEPAARSEDASRETRHSVHSLHKLGWSKEDIAKNLHLEVYEVKLLLEEDD